MIRLYVGVALFAALFGLFTWGRTSIENTIRQEFELAAANQALARKAEVAKVEEKVLTQYQEVKTEIRYVDREVTKEVIKYRDRVVNRCILDAEWVRIYNASLQPVRNAESPIRVASQP